MHTDAALAQLLYKCVLKLANDMCREHESIDAREQKLPLRLRPFIG